MACWEGGCAIGKEVMLGKPGTGPGMLSTPPEKPVMAGMAGGPGSAVLSMAVEWTSGMNAEVAGHEANAQCSACQAVHQQSQGLHCSTAPHGTLNAAVTHVR